MAVRANGEVRLDGSMAEVMEQVWQAVEAMPGVKWLKETKDGAITAHTRRSKGSWGEEIWCAFGSDPDGVSGILAIDSRSLNGLTFMDGGKNARNVEFLVDVLSKRDSVA